MHMMNTNHRVSGNIGDKQHLAEPSDNNGDTFLSSYKNSGKL